MAKILLRTRNVGAPHASTSCASGSARQSFRRRVIGREEDGMRKASGSRHDRRRLHPIDRQTGPPGTIPIIPPGSGDRRDRLAARARPARSRRGRRRGRRNGSPDAPRPSAMTAALPVDRVSSARSRPARWTATIHARGSKPAIAASRAQKPMTARSVRSAAPSDRTSRHEEADRQGRRWPVGCPAARARPPGPVPPADPSTWTSCWSGISRRRGRGTDSTQSIVIFVPMTMITLTRSQVD